MYKESRWEIRFVEDKWRTTHFFTSTYGTQGYTYDEFDTEQEALVYMLRWS